MGASAFDEQRSGSSPNFIAHSGLKACNVVKGWWPVESNRLNLRGNRVVFRPTYASLELGVKFRAVQKQKAAKLIRMYLLSAQAGPLAWLDGLITQGGTGRLIVRETCGRVIVAGSARTLCIRLDQTRNCKIDMK